MCTHKKAVAELLFSSKAVAIDTRGGFELKVHKIHSGAPLSPIYLNIRPAGTKGGKLTEAHFRLIGQALADLVHKQNISAQWVAAIPEAGNPILEALLTEISGALQLCRSLRLFKAPSSSGAQAIVGISGEDELSRPHPQDTLILVDDVVTNADSKIEAAKLLGCRVTDIIVLVDRSKGAAKALLARDIKLHAVLTLKELLDHGVERGFITKKDRRVVVSYPKRLRKYLMHNQTA